MKKRLIALFLFLCMIVSLVPAMTISADAVTYSQVVSWMDSKIGKSLDFDGKYGIQCADFVNYYFRDVWGIKDPIKLFPVLSIYKMFDYDAPSGWKKINGAGNYRVGDVVVWNKTSAGPDGHVGVVYSVNGSTVKICQQNYNGMQYVTVQKIHGTSYIRGVFRPPLQNYSLYCYKNYSGKNYLLGSDLSSGSLKYIESRNTKVSRVSVDTSEIHNGYNTLKVVNDSAGSSSSNDLTLTSSVQGTTKNSFVGVTKNMTLSFWAKSSKAGTKVFFRWGYESSANARSVTLSKEWKKYEINMNHDASFDGDIHPWVSQAGTIWLSEMQLEDGLSPTSFVPENGGLYKTVDQSYGTNYTLPAAPTRTGYSFDGWYTAASGGNKITSSTSVAKGHNRVYAHWIPNNYTFEYYYNYSGKNYLLGSDFSVFHPEYIYPTGTTIDYLGVDPSNKHNGTNSLKVVSSAAGSTDRQYITLISSTQGASSKNYSGDQMKMTLSFWAKSSVAGTKFTFRWGYESAADARTVTLSKDWKKYTIAMDKVPSFDEKIHAWMDRTATVWFSEMQLENGSSATAFAAETGGLYQSVSQPYGGTLQTPAIPKRSGYLFLGWMSKKNGIDFWTNISRIPPYNLRLQARWARFFSFQTASFSDLSFVGQTNMKIGETRQLDCPILDEDGTDLQSELIWNSSDPAVASVEGGLVTALSPGTAVITAETVYGETAKSGRISVYDPAAEPPKADKTELDNAINAASNCRQADYTPESFGALEEALSAAKAVQADENASQDAVNDAAAAVRDAVTALQTAEDRADKKELNDIILAAENVDSKKCSDESAAVLADALAEAKIVQADENAAQKAVDDAARTLQEAISALMPRFRFDDVRDERKYYYAPVYWAYEAKPQITNGVDKTHFGPDQGCTRGQVVTFLWRAAGCPEPKSDANPFTDVIEGAFYFQAVRWAVENRITNGMTASTFVPGATCTRAQIVTFLWRYKNSPAANTAGAEKFTDVNPASYYSPAVAWAVENGITKGMTDTSFAPDITCTRGQVATFLYRAVGKE